MKEQIQSVEANLGAAAGNIVIRLLKAERIFAGLEIVMTELYD